MWDFICFPAAEEEQPSLYSVLEVSMLASPAEIKQQFRRLALLHHPDKAGNGERFQAIRDAFEVLKDPAARFNYDKTLLHQLDMQEYLDRFSELTLTIQGLSLPLHHCHWQRPAERPQQQQRQLLRCQPHLQRHQAYAPLRPAMLTRA